MRAWAFDRRDYAAGFWAPRQRPAKPIGRIQRPALATLWRATLLRERLGLFVWAFASSAVLCLMASLEPTVTDMWDKFQITQRVIGSGSGHTLEAQYLSFAGQMVAPIVAAYVIAQGAGWVNGSP